MKLHLLKKNWFKTFSFEVAKSTHQNSASDTLPRDQLPRPVPVSGNYTSETDAAQWCYKFKWAGFGVDGWMDLWVG